MRWALKLSLLLHRTGVRQTERFRGMMGWAGADGSIHRAGLRILTE
jgi:hypothetical protein